MNTDEKIQTLKTVFNLLQSTQPDGQILLQLEGCRIKNIPLCEEFTKARQFAPQHQYASVPGVPNARQIIPDALDNDPRFADRDIEAKVAAKDFESAVDALYELVTRKDHVITYYNEQDGGAGGYGPHIFETGFRFESKKSADGSSVDGFYELLKSEYDQIKYIGMNP